MARHQEIEEETINNKHVAHKDLSNLQSEALPRVKTS